MGLESLIYEHECLGIDGKPIIVYKIRTMILNAHDLVDEVLEQGTDEYGKPIGDYRITRIGRALRRYWIDEIPQLYNLLKGDLKLVGIRAKSRKYWKKYPEDFMIDSLKCKPGLIGVQYAFKGEGDFNTDVENCWRYLREFRKKPLITDLKYFFRVWFNIIFRGVRSS